MNGGYVLASELSWQPLDRDGAGGHQPARLRKRLSQRRGFDGTVRRIPDLVRIQQQQHLKTVLQAAKQQGQFDSEGVFTLDRHRAAGTLAAFLLPPGGDWILKFVQGACLAQARSLAVTETAGRIQLVLEFGTETLDYQPFVKSLMEPDLQGGWSNHLSQGLRALGLGERRAWSAKLEGQGQTTEITCEDGRVTAQTQATGRSPGRGRLWLSTVVSQLGGRHEVDLLRARATCSSVPLTVNGERIDHLLLPREGHSESFPIGVHWMVGPQRNGLRIPSGARDLGHWSYVPAYTPDSRVNRMMAVHFQFMPIMGKRGVHGSAGSSSLNLVRHGVMVRSCSLNLRHPISVDLFLFAEDEQTDVSGLQADLSPRQHEQAEEELAVFSGAFRELARQMKEQQWRPRRQELLTWLGVGAASFVVTPLLSPLIGMGAAGWALRHKRQNAEVRQRAVESLESFRRQLPLVIRR